ncbi:hypothetical protein M408DRAFT_300994 [Serendipita vermifera MAFF 305830]|uniref:CCAAT-binding factor domain-containing protein n=1 Tax=Serendipita vermifera MAFF 305830 TaxID=933852 RepID=A0A0C3AAV0_SERVB|nr:hypothetical protein M408DRAFT_300994 [Serendipita vermifera MAFF 305830]
MPPPSKRRKIDSDDEENGQKRIESLEQELQTAIETSASLNSLADLLKVAKKNKKQPLMLHKAIYALYRVFSLLISANYYHSPSRPSEKELIVRRWLVERLDQYLELLASFSEHPEPAISQASTQIPFSLLKQLSTSLSVNSGHPQMHTRILRQIVQRHLSSAFPPTSLEELVNKYDDIRWFTLREITGLFRIKGMQVDDLLVETSLHLLEHLNSMPKTQSAIKSFYIPELSRRPDGQTAANDTQEEKEEEDDWRAYFDTKPEEEAEEKNGAEGRASQLSTHKALHSLQSHRGQFSMAWLAVLQHIKTSPQQSSRVLSILHRSIMPHLIQPIQLMDWISACVDFDGSIALLAFNALFVLIQEHNLDYPDFYTRLYAVLDRNIMHVKYRARFFRLLELFLSSTHLPATLLASFAKRLSRLSLSAPPSAIIMIIPFIYNILKRHPSLMTMIHRLPDENTPIDPFLPDEPSPLLTNALSSSLWEINSHKKHYVIPVATLIGIFSEPFTKPSYIQEDFLDHTYGTMYTADSKRKVTQEPALTLTLEGPLFETPGESPDKWADVSDPCNLISWST